MESMGKDWNICEVHGKYGLTFGKHGKSMEHMGEHMEYLWKIWENTMENGLGNIGSIVIYDL